MVHSSEARGHKQISAVLWLSPFPASGKDSQVLLKAEFSFAITFDQALTSSPSINTVLHHHPFQGYDDAYADQSYEGYEGYYGQGQG